MSVREPIIAICDRCGASVQLELGMLSCPDCGGAMTIHTDPVSVLTVPEPATQGLWRYADLFPHIGPAITLGEPITPVLSLPWRNHPAVRFKLELLLPSGSFKDRGSAFLVSYLKGAGAERVIEDSSGNAGASLAAYAARASIPCGIYLPDHTSPGKIAQVSAYGARVERIVGPRSAATVAVQQALAWDAGVIYAAHLWHPLFLLGMQTFGFELFEQLGGRSPDVVIAPAGSGGLVLGAIQAFDRLRDGGLISQVPRVYAVQSDTCDPIVRQFDGESVPTVDGATLAEGILVVDPPRLQTVTKAIQSTGGSAVRVTDAALTAAMTGMGAEGVWIEPTSAVAVAALEGLLADGTVTPDQDVVVALTGSGLKTSAAARSDRV